MKLITSIDTATGCIKVTGVTFPKRKTDSHKYNYGCDIVIGGCIGYTGAPYYAAEAASRAGAGLVLMGVPESIYTIEAVKCASAMPFPLPSDSDGRFSENAANLLAPRFEKTDACLIGPGMGRSKDTKKLTHYVIENFKKQLIVDADGINALIGHIDVLGCSALPVILTPHSGEFARIGGETAAPRHIAAAEFSQKHNCIVVLKGPGTVTAFPDGDVFINTTGGPGLAKGGSGDVLAGIILALVGQGFDVKTAVPAAVYLHGLCGDICENELGQYSVLPEDLINAVPKAILQLMR